MKSVYMVCWGSASQDDNGNAKAYASVHDVYAFRDDAKKGLIACKNAFYNEIVNNPDYDEEEREFAKTNTSVYGSTEDDYFEIDYFAGDIPCEIYISLVEKKIIE